MKIIPNIPGFVKLITCLKYFRPYKKPIEKARARGDFEEERRQILLAENLWGPMMLQTFGSSLTVHGEENIPDEGPVVIVANHQGYCDIPTLFATFTKFPIAFVAKEELRKLPFYGEWIERIRSVFLSRDDTRAAFKAIKDAISHVEKGFSMVIFPEGTRSKGPKSADFMRGALKLGTKSGVPIIPVSINGTYKMFEERGVFAPADIHVIVHKPIPTAGISPREEIDLNGEVERIVKEGIAKLQAEEEE